MKIFVTDLDGTLLKDDGSISDSTIIQIKEFIENGNIFMIATGRNYTNVKHVKNNIDHQLTVISVNGGVITDGVSGDIIFEEILTLKEIDEVIKITEYLNIPLNLYSINNIYYFEKSPRIEHLLERNKFLNEEEQVNLIKIDKISDIAEAINKVVFTFENDEYKNELKDLLINNGKNCFFSANNLLDVMPNDINKGFAINYIRKIYKGAKIYVAGDGENDIDMLKASDVAIVMENAKDEIKVLADVITLSNEELGIKAVLKKINKEQL